MSGHSKWAGIKHKKAIVDAKRGQAFTRASREIQIAVKRGTGELAGEKLEEVRYEGYGPAGVAIMVDAFTDNRNRTSASIRHRFSKFGGNLGESNSVGWMFERKGVITANAGSRDPEDVGLAAIEAGADDVQVDGKSVEVTTPPAA